MKLSMADGVFNIPYASLVWLQAYICSAGMCQQCFMNIVISKLMTFHECQLFEVEHVTFDVLGIRYWAGSFCNLIGNTGILAAGTKV